MDVPDVRGRLARGDRGQGRHHDDHVGTQDDREAGDEMIQQGWPLWATRGDQAWAVVGWRDYRQPGSSLRELRPIGVELGTALDGSAPVELGDDLTFTTIDPTAPVVGFAS
jgi:hypothetical protein